MHSLWSDRDAGDAIARYGDETRDAALRVYTTRLLGGDRRLVLHGGGNTSVKTTAAAVGGETVEVLRVKGSGWDMASIEPPGLPAVRLAPLRALAALDALSDADMVNVHRGNLLDATAPSPSVETLLHAFLPHKFVDHTHADAVLALTDQPDGAAICAEVYGARAALVPYIMPGFALAKACAAAWRANPEVEGLILLNHGIFTFGDSAREAYERMIALVTLAEQRLAAAPPAPGAAAHPKRDVAPVAAVAPILRGLTALPAPDGPRRPFVFDFRTAPEILARLDGDGLARTARAGPVTPDHVIRTKPWPLILAAPQSGDLAGFRSRAAAALDEYCADYAAYFVRHNAAAAPPRQPLDAMPRVILMPGLGLFGLGASARAAAIAADLAETTLRVVSDAERLGRFTSIEEADIFAIEYWSLEQAKLGKAAEAALARRVVVVTGGASGIGRATAAAFRAAGAEVAILDKDGDAAAAAAAALGVRAWPCDVTDNAAVAASMAAVVAAFGGVDIVVSNAGAAWQGRIGEVAEEVLRASFELNFYGHQRIAQAAVAVMRAQGLGGVLLFNTSKQAVNPGRDFGPYGVAKAATLFLMRQYALDHGDQGIRANAVNADRIRSGLLDDAMVAARARARGVDEADYMAGNLLGREVTADDVARAFVALALAEKTTAAVLTVDGGNIAAALR
jgi:rhamnose utilization protein RhaD (predicted bifunctional aldolase and dehydrogenase)/NAD(P)-dependent dehydrogenase (short-subunit alcohol dehydrogenase family)